MLKPALGLTIYLLMVARKVSSLRCYECDNNKAAACGTDFKAYQFDTRPCPDDDGFQYTCGKQVQPPLEGGWVGVIRSCYASGFLPGLNSSNGCQDYHIESENFTALYCFCDTDYCNGAPPPSLLGSPATATIIPITLIVSFASRILLFPEMADSL